MNLIFDIGSVMQTDCIGLRVYFRFSQLKICMIPQHFIKFCHLSRVCAAEILQFTKYPVFVVAVRQELYTTAIIKTPAENISLFLLNMVPH